MLYCHRETQYTKGFEKYVSDSPKVQGCLQVLIGDTHIKNMQGKITPATTNYCPAHYMRMTAKDMFSDPTP